MVEKWEVVQRATVVEELAAKLKLYGCNCEDVDAGGITAASVDYWATRTFDMQEEFSDDDDFIFTYAELWAIMQFKAEIAAVLNNK